MGNSRAFERQRLTEGERYEKAGLPSKALEAYRSVRTSTEDDAVRAEAWRRESFIHHASAAWDEALAAARESAELAGAIGRDDLLAEALNAEAAVHFSRGDLDDAMPLYARMLDLTDDHRIRGFALQNMGILHGRQNDPDAAESRLAEAYQEFQAADHQPGEAYVLTNHAGIALDRGEPEKAERLAWQAMGVARRVDDLDLLAIATLNRAEALQELGRLDEAESAASIALGQFETSGNLWRRIACLRILGDVNARRGETDIARRFWQRGLDQAREIGASLDADQLAERLARDGDPPNAGDG